MLERHDDIANWSEAAQIFELDYFNPEISHDKDIYDVTPLEVFRLYMYFGIYTRLKRKTRFLNKHPQNSLRIPYLKAIFPDAQFIHVIRDARAVVRSHLAQVRRDRYRQSIPFGSFPKPPRWREYLSLTALEQYAHQWVDLILAIRECSTEVLGSEDYLEVRYEDFCTDSHGELRRIDQFCGLDPSKRRYASIPERFVVRNDQWRHDFSSSDLKVIEEVTGPLMKELKYI